MRRAREIVAVLLDEADAGPVATKAAGEARRHRDKVVYEDAYEAAASVPKSGWKDWREAGVQFSAFHRDRTPFALPFNPDDYLWAGPFTLKMPEEPYYRRGHYRRGVRKYAAMLSKGLRLPPVALLYHEAWGWTMQDGNHRFEALVKAGAPTYDAFLAKPKRKKPIDSF